MANPSQITLVFVTFGKWTFPGNKGLLYLISHLIQKWKFIRM